MNTFLVNSYIPTLSTYCHLAEFNNKNYIDVNKFIAGNDNVGLSDFFDNFLKEHQCNNAFDKFFVLLYLRSICIGSSLKFKIDNETTMSLNIINILQKLINSVESPLPDYFYKDLKIVFKLPDKLYHSNFISFLYDIIYDIKIPNSLEEYKALSSINKFKIIKNLKKEIIFDIKNHIKSNQKRFNLIDINEDIGFKNNKFSFYDNSAFFILKFFYRTNITSLYNKLYHCCQKLSLSFMDYCSLTSSETNILLAIYKKNNNIK
jgi:hypothetical protein